jgi:hypothetical protein
MAAPSAKVAADTSARRLEINMMAAKIADAGAD